MASTDAVSRTPARSLSDETADGIRRRIVEGELVPGQQLSEAALAESFEISRNTLREVFRILTHEGLLTHIPHRGVFVAVPSIAAIIDIYRVRRIVEGAAIAEARPRHPASREMRRAVEDAEAARERGDWQAVGSANMRFHAAIIALADSERLDTFYRNTAAELRLAFGLIDDPEFLHAPYLDVNRTILELLENGEAEAARTRLDDYLVESERTILAAYARRID